MTELTEYLTFNGWKVDQLDAIDAFGSVYKEMFMAINGDIDFFSNQSFRQFFDKGLVAAVHIRIPSATYNGDMNFFIRHERY
jgi:hypothetical protein